MGLIDVEKIGWDAAYAETSAWLTSTPAPLFEAAIRIEGALALADVMLPEPGGDGLRWRMIEVKSSTRVKDYQRDDIAVQAYIAATAGVRLSSISLAHIDRSFVYPGNNKYKGLFKENDLTAEAISRRDEVKAWIDGAQAVAARTDEPKVVTGPHCNNPFTCGFAKYCNRDQVLPAYPLYSLPRLHPSRRERIETAGYKDLRDVPDEFLGAIHKCIKQCSISGETYFDAVGAAADLAPHGFPAFFLDFETAMFAVPIWKDTRPYQQIPFQFSLHILAENGDLQHHGFLDLSGDDPSRACAQSLADLCGDRGPVFAYNSSFECQIMHELAARFPEFAPALSAIISRVVDLLPIAKKRYYHPSQHGSWSIKAVLPALCPDLSYDQLDGVQNGSMAVSAFMEAIDSATSPERKAEIQSQLSSYCQLDTFAMVRLWQFFSGNPVNSIPTNHEHFQT